MNSPEMSSITPQTAHNAANDMAVTAAAARVWDTLARPLSDNVFIPLAESNRTTALVALNTTLTAPRLIEPAIGSWFERSLDDDKPAQATCALILSTLLVASDGLDGAAARQSDLSSDFGAAFDPAVDLFGSFSIARQVHKRAVAEGDTLTAHLVAARVVVDTMAIASGGIGNKIATSYAAAHGVELEKSEQAKSNAASKLKYAVGSVGTAAIRASHLLPEKIAKPTKRAGQALVLGSILVGLKGNYDYAKSTVDKIGRVRAAQNSTAEA